MNSIVALEVETVEVASQEVILRISGRNDIKYSCHTHWRL
jgi:hypothetical protein